MKRPESSLLEKVPGSKFDPIAGREALFQEIEDAMAEIRPTLSQNGNPIELVFRASLEDGLALAKRLRLTPDEIKGATQYSALFAQQHNEVYKKFNNKLRDLAIAEKINDYLSQQVEAVAEKRRDHIQFDLIEEGIRKNNFPPEIKKLFEKIYAYYAEFLPYRAEEFNLPESINKKTSGKLSKQEEFNLKKESHVANAERILFQKYAQALADFVINYPDAPDIVTREYVRRRLALPGLVGDDFESYVDLVMAHIDQNNSDAKLPQVRLHFGGGKIQVFDLEKARKPVAKIVETNTKRSLIKDIEKMLPQSTEFHYRVVKDVVMGKQIITKEYLGNMSKHEKHDFLEQGRKAFFDAMDFVDGIATKYNIPGPDGTYQSAEVFFRSFDKVIEDGSLDDLEMKRFFKTFTSFDSHPALSITEHFELYSSCPKKFFRKAFQEQKFREFIEDGRIEGIAEFVLNLDSGAITHDLSQQDLANISKVLLEKLEHPFEGQAGIDAATVPELNKLMDLVRTLENPNLEELRDYFEPNSNADQDKAKKQSILRQMISKSVILIKALRAALSDKVSSLLETMSAKSDKNEDLLAQRLVKACYPYEWAKWELHEEMLHNRRSKTLHALSGGMMGESHAPSLTHNRLESTVAGGNVGSSEFQESAKTTIATFSEPVSGMLVTNIVGYDPVSKVWKRNYVPVDGDVIQNRTFKKVMAKAGDMPGSIVPAVLGSKNFQSDGIDLTRDSMGLVHIEGARKIQEWSCEIPQGITAPGNITEKTHTRFLMRFIQEKGGDYLVKNPDLPIECKMFADSIASLSPRERLIKIQEFAMKHFYYDAEPNPLREKMNRGDFSERTDLMKMRLEMLGDQNEIKQGYLFAGVCADFAVVIESLCREAGIAACVVEGFSVNNKTTINANMGHARVGVFWPDDEGKTVLYDIEITPPAVTPEQQAAYQEQGISPQPIQEIIQQAIETDQAEIRETEQEISELEKSLERLVLRSEEGASLTVQERAMLDGAIGELRDRIATYIRASTNLGDIATLKGVLNAVRFSPVLVQSDPKSKVAGMKFVQSEYQRLVQDYESRDGELERISHLGKNFLGELDIVLSKAKSEGQIKPLITYIGSISSLGGMSIPESHRKIWEMVAAYVRAKGIA